MFTLSDMVDAAAMNLISFGSSYHNPKQMQKRKILRLQAENETNPQEMTTEKEMRLKVIQTDVKREGGALQTREQTPKNFKRVAEG